MTKAKKVTVIQPSTNFGGLLDIKLGMKDVIDIIMQEEEDKLTAELEQAIVLATQAQKNKEDYITAMKSKLEKSFLELVAAAFGLKEQDCTASNYSYRDNIEISVTHDKSDLSVNKRFPYTKKYLKGRIKLGKICNDLQDIVWRCEQRVTQLNKKSRKARTLIVKQLLANTPEGATLLQQVTKAKQLLITPK